MSTTCYKINTPAVIHEMFDGELVAIHLDTGAYHSLLGAGADVFLLLGHEATLDELAVALEAKYDAPVELIAAGLAPLLESLEKEQLIVKVDQRTPRAPLTLPAVEVRIPLVPPTLEAYHDLQSLFLLDPVHEVGEQGWPQPLSAGSPLSEAKG